MESSYTSRLAMPGKCKFKDSWLSKGIYKDWLVKDVQDIHFARCRACCKSIKLMTMGEAALTSHAGGAGHKAAVLKLVEAGKLMMTNSSGEMNGGRNQSLTVDNKDQVAICLQRDSLDRITGSEVPDLHHSPTTNSTSHNAELQDVFPTFFTAPGTSRLISQRLHPPDIETEEAGHPSTQDDSSDLPRMEYQQRTEALEQQMKILEWENRMKVLAWEMELVREKRKAARQKEKALRMKTAYYKAKLKRMGEDMPPSSPSSCDEEQTPDLTG